MQDFQKILGFIIGEIPFLLLMAFLIYIFWIRPKRKANRENNDPNRDTQPGDEILFRDGLVGLITKYKDGIVTVESGSRHDKYQIKEDFFVENLDVTERVKEEYNKLSLWQKILSKI